MVATPTVVDPRARGATPPRVLVTPMRSRGVVSQPEDRHRTREAGVPFLLERDTCRVVNVDDVTHVFQWDKRSFMVRPNEEGLVPFPALVNALGDPRSAPNEQIKFRTDDGQTGIILTRYESIRTLFSRYATENEDIDDMVAFAPKVQVFHMETGTPITFPSQDPDCPPWPVPMHHAPGREPSGDRAKVEQVLSENAELRDEVAELRRLITERLDPNQTPQPQYGSPVQGGQTADMSSALLGMPGTPGMPGAGGAEVDRGPASTFQ